MAPMRDESPRVIAAIGAITAVAVAGLLVSIRDWLGASNVALILAIVVVGAAVFGGRFAGVVTSIAAALSFDYFHTQPFYTLRINNREDVITAVLLLVLGLAVGELADPPGAQPQGGPAPRPGRVAPRGRRVGRRRRRRPGRGVARRARRARPSSSTLAECRFEPVPFTGPLTDTGAQRPDLGGPMLHWVPGGFDAAPQPGVQVPVVHEGRLLGRLVLVPRRPPGHDPSQRRVAVGLADQLAVAAAHIHAAPSPRLTKGPAVADLLFVVITIAFFVVCVGYVPLCDRIIGPDPASTEGAGRGRARGGVGRDGAAVLFAGSDDGQLHRARDLGRPCSSCSSSSSCSRSGSDVGGVLRLARPPHRRPADRHRSARAATWPRSTSNDKAPGDRVFTPIERLIYRILRVDPEREQRWNVYTLSLAGVQPRVGPGRSTCSSGCRRGCHWTNGLANVDPKMAWNTAISFVTNTNWQSYSGESTMGHLVQMAGLAVQNFVSAAVGMCIVVALIRGLARRTGRTLGNFWVDLTRTTTRILLPISFVIAARAREPGRHPELHAHDTAKPLDQTVQVQTTDDPATR